MTRQWLQVSLRTLLAMVLAFCVGLAVNYRFHKEASDRPDPRNIRMGDRLTVVWNPEAFPVPARWTLEVLSDGCIRLPELGQVPAAGLSLDALTQQLSERYSTYYSTEYKSKIDVKVFVSFENTSVEQTEPKHQ
jgi:protein involved in polysaccharide export with SLBB domain